MHIATEFHDNLSCEIHISDNGNLCSGILKYKIFETGRISGPNEASIRSQFHSICTLADDGAMIRHGIIMLGYHNGEYRGEVLHLDGKIIGKWTSDEFEWCHFTAYDTNEITCSGPSPWLLHDAIANWLNKDKETQEV